MDADTKAIVITNILIKAAGKIDKLPPSLVVKKLWDLYSENYKSNNSVNGSVFEEILGFILAKEGCLPFYMQAKVAYVPNVNYDFILYDDVEGPIALSAKTSLRERWKQADLEAVALKYVHRNALSYAITLDKSEAAARTLRIKECMAINDFVLATDKKFDELIASIKKRNLSKSGKIEVIVSKTVIDKSNYAKRYKRR